MKTERMRRRTRRAVLLSFVWLLAALAMTLVTVAVLSPETARQAAAAYTEKGAPQETAMDWFQEPPYAVALAVCAAMVVRVRRRAERLPLWVLLGFVAGWLLWRELPWDERILGANTFSWTKYLARADVPLWARIAFGGGSIAVTAALAAYAVWRLKAVLRLALEKVRSASGWLLAASGLALAAAQMVDKHRTADALLGTNLSAWALKDYLEESLEIFGPVLLVMACVMAALEEPPGGAPPRPAAPSAATL